MHPFSGNWTANLRKSQRHPNQQFGSASLRFEIAGEEISLTQSGVNMSGKQESSTLNLRADGHEHPVNPGAPEVLVVTKWRGTHLLDTQASRAGAVLGRGTYEVSADGLTLTARVQGVDAQGAAFEQVIVFDRE